VFYGEARENCGISNHEFGAIYRQQPKLPTFFMPFGHQFGLLPQDGAKVRVLDFSVPIPERCNKHSPSFANCVLYHQCFSLVTFRYDMQPRTLNALVALPLPVGCFQA